MTHHRGKRHPGEGVDPADALALFTTETEWTAPPVPSRADQPILPPPVAQPEVQSVVQSLVPPAAPDEGPPAASTDPQPGWTSSSESKSTAPLVPRGVPGDWLPSASTDRLPTWALTTAAGIAALALAVGLFTHSRRPAQSNEASALSPSSNAERLAAPIAEVPAIPSVSSGAPTAIEVDARTPVAAAPGDIAKPLQQPPPRTNGESPRVRRESQPSSPPSTSVQGELDSRPLTDFSIPAPVLSPALPKVEVVAETPVALPDDYTRIQAVLDAYTRAYERLDVVAVAILWPGVDTRALSRAFGTVSRQNVAFDRCDISVAGTHATANCDGVIEYVRSVGDAAPQSRSTSWMFALNHSAGDWRIATITAR